LYLLKLQWLKIDSDHFLMFVLRWIVTFIVIHSQSQSLLLSSTIISLWSTVIDHNFTVIHSHPPSYYHTGMASQQMLTVYHALSLDCHPVCIQSTVMNPNYCNIMICLVYVPFSGLSHRFAANNLEIWFQKHWTKCGRVFGKKICYRFNCSTDTPPL
jgi:hypothetical protein